MSRFIPYLSDEAIERDAAVLLAEYAHARGVVIEPPIPIEDIVEKHLKLGIEFDDTHKLFGVPRPGPDPDILGAIFFDDRRIVIDETLDPEENPAKGYRFTLAHEGGGHWRLHRHLFAKDPAQAALFGGPAMPSFVCRSSEAKKREEWQADFYSSCLLMPRKLVFAAWDEMFPDRKQRSNLARRQCCAAQRAITRPPRLRANFSAFHSNSRWGKIEMAPSTEKTFQSEKLRRHVAASRPYGQSGEVR
jgi:hypothetical protein